METNGINDNHPQGNDGLNLYDLHDQPQNGALAYIPQPVNLRTRGTVNEGRGNSVGGFKPHGHDRQAPTAGHNDGEIHHCGHGRQDLQWDDRRVGTVTVRGGGVTHTPQVEIPHTVWDQRNIGSQKKARSCYLASKKRIKSRLEVGTTSRGAGDPRDRNVCTVEVPEEIPKKG
ncbi:hypothetical protein LIER_22708 [Lithospermum erythrorhizon]|uniref:Uncharacterized protein n=1 Tax=Lithospermum erythrorhizon TaxID=34254 RepID=A0AAV3QWE3_LITER